MKQNRRQFIKASLAVAFVAGLAPMIPENEIVSKIAHAEVPRFDDFLTSIAHHQSVCRAPGENDTDFRKRILNIHVA